MRCAFLPVLAACLALPGCGGGPSIVAVSGTVTLDGEPLANANLSFQPMGSDMDVVGPGSYGKTDAKGRFTLKTVDKDKAGAVVGMHRVRVSIAEPGGADAGGSVMKDKLPPWYNFDTSLQFDVPKEGTAKADFELFSKKQ